MLGCYIFEDFEDQEQTIPQDLVLKMTKTEGENKVYIANFAGYKGGITGTLNAEEGYIDFGGGQTMVEISTTDPDTGDPVTMKLLLLSVHEGDNENLYDDVTFTIDDDGSLVLDQSGIYIYIDGGPYDGQGAGYFTDLVLPKCNAKETVSNDFGNGSAPTEISNEVLVEDLETAVNVYGMLGQSFVSFNINDDRTVNVEFDQPLMATPSSADTSRALIRTVPPSGVNFRALSAIVLIMKRVRIRSALTNKGVGSTTRFSFFNLNAMRDR